MLRSRKKAEPVVSNELHSENEAKASPKKVSESQNEDDSNILIGCTPSGDEFVVPKTTSMISSLFSPDFSKKNAFDYFTLSILLSLVYVFLCYSGNKRHLILGFSFAFWRLSYNLGLGYLLRWQSQRQGLVTLWKRYIIKQKGKEGKLGEWIRAQLEGKMGPDYDFYVKQWLIFDGVFEMAPHPMYSIGYAGYYGASLITGSYVVFFASVVAHIMQFLFLISVENPHIEKT
ncbi:Phosphatidylethanolamine N-methyltransferase, partial [Smittium culicis]